jgi:signal transduction histidine kinase
MDLHGLFIQGVPFPYFILNQDLLILSSSDQAKDRFICPTYFVDLVDFKFHKETQAFLTNSLHKPFIEVPMTDKHETENFFQIYRAMDEQNYIHVYCFPIGTEMAEIQELVSRVKNKLSNFDLEIKDKKQYLEKTVHEMKEAALNVEIRENIGNLAAGIAHEIRNPLTTVKGFIQLLKPYLIEIGKEQYADIALEEINRANDIIFEFLNAAKPHVNKKESTSLNQILRDMAILYESETNLNNIVMQTALADEDVEVLIDANQLKQVLLNLIKNAIEAINDAGSINRHIHLSTIIEAGFAAVQVKDSGPGMTKETLDQIFMTYYSTKEKGTGIGLSLCKKMIEDQGGKIVVNSTLGESTCFSVYLPYKTKVLLANQP